MQLFNLKSMFLMFYLCLHVKHHYHQQKAVMYRTAVYQLRLTNRTEEHRTANYKAALI